MHTSCKFKAVNLTDIISLRTQFRIKRVVTTNNNYAPPAVCCLKKFSGMDSTECSAMNIIAVYSVIMYVYNLGSALMLNYQHVYSNGAWHSRDANITL